MLQSPSNAVFGSTLSYTSFTTVTLFRKNNLTVPLEHIPFVGMYPEKKTYKANYTDLFSPMFINYTTWWILKKNGEGKLNSELSIEISGTQPNRSHMTIYTISLSEEILICLASMDNVPNMSAMQLRSKHKLVTHLSSCCQH